VWPASALAEALADAAGVVLALPLTPATDGLIGAAELTAMGSGAWLVNVARGRHVRTDDLVAALRDGVIAGAALDVTDPEPLAAEHPLRRLPNCVVTPHIGYSPGQVSGLLADRIAANVRRAAAGEPLLGSVDPGRGY
jgi:D-3-phosphoglycerate dehydrogenase